MFSLKFLKRIFPLPVLLPLLLSGGFLLFFRLIRKNRQLVNQMVRYVTSPVKRGVSWLCEPFPFGIAELCWAAAILFLLFFAVRSLYLIFSRSEHLLTLAQRLTAACSIALSLYAGYTLMWGINYYADSFCDMTGFTTRGCSVRELFILTTAFADRASELAPQMPRDEEGLYSQDVRTVLRRTPAAFSGLEEEFPCMKGTRRTPKPMIFSRIMSHLNFTGFYFPFTAESMVNVDQPTYLVPVTALHELCHQRNIAPEDECNFLAILAGMDSGDPEFEYSACMFAYIHLANALFAADRTLWQEADTHLSEIARQDDRSNTLYWRQFQTPARTVGTTVYETFLQSFEQTDGMKSYGKCVDLLAAYYFDQKPQAQFWH